jgi:hypothetical protein
VEALAAVSRLPVAGKNVAKARVDNYGLVRVARVRDTRAPEAGIGGGTRDLGVKDRIVLVAGCCYAADGGRGVKDMLVA